ncbi:MAG: hypothetical protein ACYTG6_11575, partial [Planctomycetota bacterium]
VASDLAVVADDFVVDVWVNGERLPLDNREMVAEIHGAMTERIHVDLHEGDWVVFHVVANRMRWNGASYFGVHATGPEGKTAFTTDTDGRWTICDDPSRVESFLANREPSTEAKAIAPANPWHEAPRLWRDLLGHDFTGEPVWGRAPSTWIKYVVGAPAPSLPSPPPGPSPAGDTGIVQTIDMDSRAYWEARLSLLRPGMSLDEVLAVVPPWPEGGGQGVGMTGGGFVSVYQVSARWIAQVTFTHQEGMVEGPLLLDAAGPSSGDALLCLVTEKAYHHGWKTVGEILLDTEGRYGWTRYDDWSVTAPSHHSVQGTVPSEIVRLLEKDFAEGSRQYVLGLDDSKTRHPPGVTALLEFLRAEHPIVEVSESGN